MSRKPFHMLIFVTCASYCILLPGSVQSSYCSDLVNKCRKKCYEITLDDILKGECMDACQEDLNLCYKKHPVSECQDTVEDLRYKVRDLERKLYYLGNKIQ